MSGGGEGLRVSYRPPEEVAVSQGFIGAERVGSWQLGESEVPGCKSVARSLRK